MGCTTDICDEDQDLVVHAPDDAACSNDLFCDGAEVCSATEDCQPGEAPALDDAVDCTVDGCDPLIGCVYPEKECATNANLCTEHSCDENTGDCIETE